MSAAQRRRQLTDVAASVIVSHGIHAFSFRNVAEAAGISQPLVSAHFRSRDELIEDAFTHADRRALELIEARVEVGATGLQQVRALVLESVSSDPVVVESWDLWHQVWSYGRFAERVQAAIRTRQQTWIALVDSRIREGQRDGSIDAEVDALPTAQTLVSLLDGVAISVRADALTVVAARDILSRALDMMLLPPADRG